MNIEIVKLDTNYCTCQFCVDQADYEVKSINELRDIKVPICRKCITDLCLKYFSRIKTDTIKTLGDYFNYD